MELAVQPMSRSCLRSESEGAYPSEVISLPKMGKCYQIKHFLDFLRIQLENSQPKNLMTLEIKKVSHQSHQSPKELLLLCGRGIERNQLKTEGFGLPLKSGSGAMAVKFFFSGEDGLVVALASFQEMVNDASQLVGSDSDGFGSAVLGAHTPVEFAQTGLAVVQRLRGHAQGAGQPLPDLPRARG